MGFKVRQETTVETLQAGEITIDKTGTSWTVERVSTVAAEPDEVTFVIAGIKYEKSEGKRFTLTKPFGSPITVVREKSTGISEATPDDVTETATVVEENEAAVAALKGAGAEILVQATVADADAVAAIAEGESVVLPPFASLTDLEQRTHVFVMHGSVAYDIMERVALTKLHERLHAAPPKAKAKPHTHEVA
jgi:hypothetical protein